jgi:hypothetical protein
MRAVCRHTVTLHTHSRAASTEETDFAAKEAGRRGSQSTTTGGQYRIQHPSHFMQTAPIASARVKKYRHLPIHRYTDHDMEQRSSGRRQLRQRPLRPVSRVNDTPISILYDAMDVEDEPINSAILFAGTRPKRTSAWTFGGMLAMGIDH